MKKRTKKKSNYKISGGKEDEKQRRKYNKGGRIEAYTWGDVMKSKNKKHVTGW